MNNYIKAEELAADFKAKGYNPFENPFTKFDLNVLKGDGIFLPGYIKSTLVGIHDFVIVSTEKTGPRHLLWYPLLNSELYDEFNMIDTAIAYVFTESKWNNIYIWSAGAAVLEAEENVGAPNLIIMSSPTSGDMPNLEVCVPVFKEPLKFIEEYCNKADEDEGFYFSFEEMLTTTLVAEKDLADKVKMISQEAFFKDNKIIL